MRQNGQLHIEAIICIALFISALSAALAGLDGAKESANAAEKSLIAKAGAEACCISVDSFYGNSADYLLEGGRNCTGNGGTVQSGSGGKTKQSQCIAGGIKTVQAGEKSVLEVAANGHYR